MSSQELAEMPIPEVNDPRQRAYLVALVVSCGQRGLAAEAAGVSRWTVQRWKAGQGGRPPDPAYLAALEVAEDLAAQRMEDIAVQRATEGLRSYKFDKNGNPLRHPKRCECGHRLEEHEKPQLVTQKATSDGPEPVTTEVRACLACTCEDFHGEPYYELNVSDKLLQTLLRAKKPKEYATRRIEHTGQIDWDRLPDHLVARIARGEDVNAVLASAADEGQRYLLGSGAELSGPIPGSDGTAGELIERDEGEEEGDSAGEDAPRWLDL
jgi:hypothetical protein